jgi:hypothetical protein
MNRSFLARIGNLVIAAGVLALAQPAAAEPVPAPTLKIVLQVRDDNVPLYVVLRARSEVTRIYEQAGITISWIDVESIRNDAVHVADKSGPAFALVIPPPEVTDRMIVGVDALGGATGTAEQRGRLAYVFYDRVERVAREHLNRAHLFGTYEVDTVLVLGHAMAHELGHLLLPHGHSATGLMRADWNAEDFRAAVRGELNFTAEQAAIIRARLQPETRPSNADGF